MNIKIKSILFYLLFLVGFIVCCYVAFPKTYTDMSDIAKLLIFLIPLIIGFALAFVGAFFFYKNYKFVNNKLVYTLSLVFNFIIVGGLFALYVYLNRTSTYYQTIIGYVVESGLLICLFYSLIKPLIKKY